MSSSQISFRCEHCQQEIFIPAGLPPTTAPCPHCNRNTTSPDTTQHPVSTEGEVYDTSPLPLQPEPLETRPKRTFFWIFLALILLGAIGALGYFYALPRWKARKAYQRNAAQKATISAEAHWMAKGWQKDANKVLNNFLMAKTPKEKSHYAIQNPGVEEQLAHYYPANKHIIGPPVSSFAHVINPIDQQRGIFLMRYSQPSQIDIRSYFSPIGNLEKMLGQQAVSFIDTAHTLSEENLSQPIGINAFFKKTNEGLKLDASVFIQGKFRTFLSFIDNPSPGKSQIFRVIIAESMSHKLRNTLKKRVYTIADFAYPSDEVNVVVDAHSAIGKILLPINWRGLERERTVRTATVELTWTLTQPSRLELTDVLCWEFLGLGGVLGNTEVENPQSMQKNPTPDKEKKETHQ